MRILVVAPGPSFSVADVQHGWERAFAALGHEVRTYNLDDRLTFFSAAHWGDVERTTMLEPEDSIRLAVEPLGAMIYKWWPDVVFVVSGFFLPNDIWDVLKARPQRTVLLCTESPYEDAVQCERMVAWEPDVTLINDLINLERYRAYSPKVWYAPHAYEPSVHCPGLSDSRFECDLGIVGTGYPSRVDFLARVGFADLRVKLAGMWKTVRGTCLETFVVHDLEECFDNEDAVTLYRSSKMSANLYRARSGTLEAHHPELAEGWSVGPREIELAATETFFLREPRPEGDELFPFLPTFAEPGEFGELLHYYKDRDGERVELARRAHEAIAERTFEAHAARLMDLLPD